MTAIMRPIVALGVALAVVCEVEVTSERAQGRAAEPWWGACYCRMAQRLECTADLTERECKRRSDDALCDDWFWKERLPCWNWGYGG